MGGFETADFEIVLPDGADPVDIRVFLLLEDAIAIPIRPSPLGVMTSAPPDISRVGAPLAMVGIDASEAFTEAGWFGETAPSPLPGRGFGSFAALGDAGQGSIAIEFELPADTKAIVAPVLTGPVGRGMRFGAIDPATGAVIAELSDPTDAARWKLWTIELPSTFSGSRLELRIEDRSSEWGSWAAIGAPHVFDSADPAN